MTSGQGRGTGQVLAVAVAVFYGDVRRIDHVAILPDAGAATTATNP